mgnify:CR=1 FL=1
MNLPNKLTVGRVIAVPFFVAAFMMHHYWIALLLFCLASLTDLLDGKIARSRGLVTNFGKIMDPLADKILVYSAFCLMVGNGMIPAWVLILILAREFTVSGMRTVAASEGIVIAAAMSGKIKTVLQMLAVIALLMVHVIPSSVLTIVAYILLYTSLVMTVYSGAEYVIKNIKVFSN